MTLTDIICGMLEPLTSTLRVSVENGEDGVILRSPLGTATVFRWLPVVGLDGKVRRRVSMTYDPSWLASRSFSIGSIGFAAWREPRKSEVAMGGAEAHRSPDRCGDPGKVQHHPRADVGPPYEFQRSADATVSWTVDSN